MVFVQGWEPHDLLSSFQETIAPPAPTTPATMSRKPQVCHIERLAIRLDPLGGNAASWSLQVSNGQTVAETISLAMPGLFLKTRAPRHSPSCVFRRINRFSPKHAKHVNLRGVSGELENSCGGSAATLLRAVAACITQRPSIRPRLTKCTRCITSDQRRMSGFSVARSGTLSQTLWHVHALRKSVTTIPYEATA